MDGTKFAEIMRKVIIAGKEKMHWCKIKRFIQIDRAGHHQGAFADVQSFAKRHKIEIIMQAAQMPDENKINMAVYPAMQAHVNKLCENERKPAGTVVSAVLQVWDNLSPGTLHMTCEIKRVVLACTIEHTRGNQFKIPHIGVRKGVAWLQNCLE
ncbi:hypothetical protein CYMTET_12549 [Cymbomonas tetramitiformis]|uniref:Uncharacterized protein n=1 Tax=Cymbomonas tetramitiformis TaxID=36881 RepID=A0AAE0GLG3_9CHLO|nr:hypothetical protein CYMTET_12549 [Cymbomonas tetramitiformis]|eukprot:gene7974-9481_t